jgi:hypothetical protein
MKHLLLLLTAITSLIIVNTSKAEAPWSAWYPVYNGNNDCVGEMHHRTYRENGDQIYEAEFRNSFKSIPLKVVFYLNSDGGYQDIEGDDVLYPGSIGSASHTGHIPGSKYWWSVLVVRAF